MHFRFDRRTVKRLNMTKKSKKQKIIHTRLVFGFCVNSEELIGLIDEYWKRQKKLKSIYLRIGKGEKKPKPHERMREKIKDVDENGWWFECDYFCIKDLEEDIEAYESEGYEVDVREITHKWRTSSNLEYEVFCTLHQIFSEDQILSEGVSVVVYKGKTLIYLTNVGISHNTTEITEVKPECVLITDSNMKFLDKIKEGIKIKQRLSWCLVCI